jgi:PAS domain S-box-containing protein
MPQHDASRQADAAAAPVPAGRRRSTLLQWLGARLARRLVAAFVAVSLVPTAILAIYAYNRTSEWVVVGVGALGLVLAAVAAIAIARSIARPIDALARAADTVRLGQLDTPLPPASGEDEVGVLTHAFRQMTQRLSDMVGALQDRVAELERSDAALRAGDERLRQMIDSNLAGIVFVDMEGHVLEANNAFLRIVGYTLEDLRAGRILRDVITPPEHRDVTSNAISQARAHGKSMLYEKDFVRKDGSRVPVLIGLSVVGVAKDRVVAFVLDRSEHRQAEADREARLAAEAANRAKSEFLTRMSHELRTPLNAILGFAQLLRHQPGLDERTRHGLGSIRSAGEHLLQLINDLLDLSRIETGRFHLEPQPADLKALVDGVHAIVQGRAQEKSLRFAAEVVGMLPASVVVDELRLRQVLLNLLGNAIKYTAEGEVRLRVSATPAQPGEHSSVRFDIVDTGVGIAIDDQQRLFRPFQQVGDDRLHDGGTGLGLVISQQLVQEMGSRIEVESQPGRGTRFWFELSLQVLAAARGPEEQSAPLPSAYVGGRRRVLVVDDETVNRALLIDLLTDRGFDTDEAANGELALAQARAHRPDLVLMDVSMPVLDGLEATRRLRADPHLRDVRVITLSASPGEGNRRNAIDAGADAFIAKPLDLVALLLMMGELLALQWVERPVAVRP